MIKLNSYQPTHEQMARVEHAIVVNRRRYYALHEAGILDLAEQAHLELDYLNLCYWKHHSHSQESPKEKYEDGSESNPHFSNGVSKTDVSSTEMGLQAVPSNGRNAYPDCIPRLEGKI